MKTLLNNKKTLTITLFMIFSLHGMIFQKPPFGLTAQTSDIFLNSEWTLVDGEINNIPISVADVGAAFESIPYEDLFQFVYGNVCFEHITVSFSNVTSDSFLLGTIEEYIECNYTDPDINAAVELYKSFYFELPIDSNGTPKNPFTYEWVDATPWADELRITNPQGDWLLYQTYTLSTPAFHQDSFTLYPNPVKETLHISSTTNQAVNVSIYDLNGKLIQRHSFENKTTTLDVKSFKKGLYFIIFETETGERVSKKFVKK